MEVNLSEKFNAVRNAATLLLRSVNQQERLLPVGTSILDAYDQAEQDLLILGAPGSGKSTLLLELAQQLVERAAQDEGQPFPVILPLSSWAVKRLPLQSWIIEQLTQIYDIPRKVSEQWVQEDAILPLLDGLDEMDEAARPACINAINIYHQIHLGTPLVICSRTAEYDVAAQRQRLALQRAVIAQPLTSQQVDASLLQAGKAVAALRSAMKINPALQELATTPLMLSVLILTYQGTTVRELPRKEGLLQQQVWTDYVARMVQRKGNDSLYPLKRTRHWLTWLAQQMRAHQQTIFYAEYLHPGWLTSKHQRIAAWLTIHVPALILGVLVGLIISLFVSSLYDLSFLLQIVLLGGFVGGCLSRKAGIRTAAVASPSSAAKWVDLLSSILFGLLVAGSLGFSLGQPSYDGYSLRDWLLEGYILGVGSGLSAWAFQMFLFRTPKQHISIPFTRSFLRWHIPARITTIASQSVVWQAAIVLGAGMGLSYALSYALLQNGLNDVQSYISYGLSYGLNISLVVVLISYILDASLKPLRFAERIHWTWRSLRRPEHIRISVIVTGMIFLLFGLDYWLSNGLSIGLSNGLSIGLSSGLGYWLLVGLYQGMVQEHVKDQDRRQFNQGIRRSLRNGMFVSLVSAGIITGIAVLIGELSVWLFDTLTNLSYWLGFTLSNYLSKGLRVMPSNVLGFMLSNYQSNGLSFIPHSGIGPSIDLGLELSSEPSVVWLILISGFLLMWAMSGGLTILRHYVIRWLMARSNCFPWHAQAFLDDATARILLQRVGGGYRFTHRLLLDYFADLEMASPSATLPTASPMQQTPP